MPVNYCYLPGSRLLVSCFWGIVTPQDTPALRRARGGDPAIGEVIAVVTDATGVEEFLAGAEEIRDSWVSVRRDKDRFASAPAVIIANRNHVFGLSRIYQIHVSTVSGEQPFCVVRTWREAAEWLKVDLDEARRRAEELRLGPSL